jgi:hypothetical protein
MIQTPQHVLSAVAAESQIDRFERFEVLFSDFGAMALKIVRNRIADHQEVNIAFGHGADVLGVTFEPPIDDAGFRHGSAVLFLGRRPDQFHLKGRNNRNE